MATQQKPLIEALRGERTRRLPIWLMRQAGRYLAEYREIRSQAGSFLDLCYTPELATEVTLQPVHRFRFDAAILFSDILVVPDGLGQSVEFRDNEGPVLAPIRSEYELSTLSPEGLRDRLAPVYETIRRVKSVLSPETALIGFAGAPWTVSTYMVEGGSSKDYGNVKGWALRAPKEFARLIDLLVDATAEHLVAQADAGVDAIQIFDSWAGIVPAGLFAELCLEPVRTIAQRFKAKHPEVPIIVFPRGAGIQYSRFVRIREIDALSVDSTIPPAWAKRELQISIAVQGNMDPVALLEGGTTMRAEATRILEQMSSGPFIFNLGHGVLPATPPEHVAELVEFVRSWRHVNRIGS
ncbi:MAG: uroporphyrinogen decarboxylase [Acidiferrobacterales bacterium]